MKKRYAAGLALALVGILSGCGQTAADNTISLSTGGGNDRRPEWQTD